jgi:Tfp pilus assembly protein PilF
MITQLRNTLKEAIRRVPAMKYALAVAGILAVVGLAGAFRISSSVAAFGAVIILVLMVAMVIFARLTTVRPGKLVAPALVMMWSFLLLTIATAFLLFTCAFVRWPKPLIELTGNVGSGTSTGGAPTNSPDPRIATLIQSAELQLGARDYAGAWKAIGEAVGLAPDSQAARNEQVEIALAWVRDMRVTAPATYSEAVLPLVQCLYSALPQEKGTRASDIRAHIGWANALKWKEGVRGQQIEEEYAAAVKLDSTNPFAHAMWGHWLATQGKPLEEITNHFDLARQSGRAMEFVMYLEIFALGWDGNDLERARKMVRLADEMRRKRIETAEEARNKIFDTVYVGHSRKHEAEVVAMLPGPEHLATFLWVAKGRDMSEPNAAGYFHARLTEASGDRSKALSLYRALNAEFSPLKRQIQAGIARCQ